MIRMSKACSLGKSYWNFPVFKQRVASQPKHFLMESTAFPKESVANEVQKKESERDTDIKESLMFEEYAREIKYKFFKDTVQGILRKKGDFVNDELAMKKFFENLPSCPPSEIIKVLKVLAETRNRPFESIKTLCLILYDNKDLNCSVQEYADLLFALSRLSYRDDAVIHVISKKLKKLQTSVPSKLANNILISLAELKYKDKDLIEKLMDFGLTDSLSVKVLLNCLKALSSLNYSSPKVDSLIQHLSQFQEVDFTRSADYVNFVWSCVLLNRAECVSSHISSVLSKSFVTRVLSNDVLISLKWKLLNINAAAQQMPSYDGPLLNNHPHYKFLCLSVPKKSNAFLESVLDSLSYVIPPVGYFHPLVNTGAGFNLDVQFSTVDSDSNSKNSSKDKRGIQLINYGDVCSDGSLTGLTQFKMNTLQGLGYKMLTLRYTEYNPSDTLARKILILREKINKEEQKKVG